MLPHHPQTSFARSLPPRAVAIGRTIKLPPLGRPAASNPGPGGDRSATWSYHRKHEIERGCTHAQFLELYAFDQGLKAEGVSRDRRPIRAYISHRNNARHRGVEWGFTLWSWWCVWRDSGHWNDRGPGYGYVMCRRGDVGPYAPHNVYIATAIQNSAEGSRPLGGLPIGVRVRRGRFAVKHRRVHLGTFDTVEEAVAAYTKASNFTDDLLVRT
jgi:hypothetical protein